MFAFIMRRIGVLSVILMGSSFILYNLAAYSGDPLADLKTSQDPNRDFLMISLSRELQLDVPPPARYFLWLKGVAGLFVGHANFGKTREGATVGADLAQAIPVTLRLVLASTIIAIVLGIGIGIVTALRQYSRFDYSMTFVSFLMFSLPIFWVAVLLKQYLAISFNNFLKVPDVPLKGLALLALASGVFWASVIGGSRKTFWTVFALATTIVGAIIAIMDAMNWFLKPGLGPILVFAFAIGIAYGVTQLSVGITNKAALKSSLTVSVASLAMYYPANWIFKNQPGPLGVFAIFSIMITVAVIAGISYSKIDRAPIIRTAVLTAFLSSIILVVDKYMHTWKPYMETDAINYRPVPTIGQHNDLLNSNDFWISSLDLIMHLFLPTLALTLISFAGYIRYSRGTLLEVLNQDYIRTARAKGLTERTVIMRHAFRNTMIPLTTIMVVDFAGVIGGALITERVFGWSGMGTLFYRGILSFDLNLLMGVFFVTSTLSVLANLVADLLYSALDPRIRVGSGA
jgi:peptide/nickel transport system permease protein